MLPAPASPDVHTDAFRAVWLTRYGSLGAAAERVDQYLAQAAGNERLRLRMQLLKLRLSPQTAEVARAYGRLAQDLLAQGDAPGQLMAKALALGTTAFGGNVTAALADYEALSADIDLLQDPLEQHVALGPSLFLYQAAGNLVAYMQQACKMLRLANEVDHSGMRAAAISNLGIAYHLAGDELQARAYLEESLQSSDLGGWVRFSAVAILAEIHASLCDVDKVLPLLQEWSFPPHPQAFDGPTLANFHVLGAEVFVRQGLLQETQRYVDFIEALPAGHVGRHVRGRLALCRALLDQAEGRHETARAALAEGMALAQPADAEQALSPRFWAMAAEVCAAQQQWEQAYGLLARSQRERLQRRQDMAEVRRVATQFQADASARAVEAAQRDRLTGLGNRERLVAVGDGWLASGLSPLVGLFNVRRFNAINEALGRDVGDAVLRAVAERLREACRRFDNALAGRVYADQFAVVVANGEANVDRLRRVAAEIFATPLEVAGQWVDIGAAWGVAHGPAHGQPMHGLMSHAEIALHEDRRTDAGWTVYAAHLVRAHPRQLSLISELRRAAQHDEFVLLLQPKFSLSDNAVTAFEALIRWNHPTRGPVAPAEFIPFAESTGSIRVITAWVLRQSLVLSARLRAQGLVSCIAVNVSVHDVASDELVDTLQGLLKSTGARAQDLRLELTESAAMNDPATVIDRMRAIRALGVEWSIDDFGTGQSSLAYLHMLPVSELKIDRSFVRGATRSGTTLTLLKAAIDLGRNLNLSTVGEGAETAEEWALLRELGCGVAQGWFGAPPMAEAELQAWLTSRSRLRPADALRPGAVAAVTAPSASRR